MTTFSDAIISEMKNIAWNFFAFSKFTFNFENFPNKHNTHSWCLFEIRDSEKGG